ncbi:MAG TPA: HEAT repeat domain-containing protein, partial [Gemmatimonadaceae bacterium]|nr:HEAT repeat domain-containing protein [Gemmatimonadaceae bacterium]
VKTRQLYLPNNPIYQRSVEQLQAAFAPLWAETTELVLQIAETEFRWSGEVVHQEAAGGESLPWTCYKDGLRELTLLQGVEDGEITIFLDILQRVRKASPDEDDLLTLLWEQEFEFLRYRFVDLSLDNTLTIQPSEESGSEKRIPVVEIAREVEEDSTAQQGIVRMEDLDSTLYFLDDEEIQYLRSEVQKEQGSNLHRNVTAILLDIFELQDGDEMRAEVCAIFESYMPQLLMSRDHGTAAYLLRETAELARRMQSLKPEDRERLGRLPESLSAPGVLQQLLQVLEDGDANASQEDFEALFQELRGGTLGTVLDWLGSGRASNPAVRAALEGAAKRLAAANTGELIALIGSVEPGTALEAIRRAGELRTPAAVAPLARVLAGRVPELRRVAAQALAQIGSPGAMRVLEGVLDDADRDIRITAVRAVGVHDYRAALPKVEAVVTGKAVRDADLTEKMACFETFGLLARDEGVEQLAGLLSGRSLVLRRRIDPEVRACAAMALGRIGTPKALAVLRGAIEDKDVRVRSAINRALREGER